MSLCLNATFPPVFSSSSMISTCPSAMVLRLCMWMGMKAAQPRCWEAGRRVTGVPAKEDSVLEMALMEGTEEQPQTYVTSRVASTVWRVLLYEKQRDFHIKVSWTSWRRFKCVCGEVRVGEPNAVEIPQWKAKRPFPRGKLRDLEHKCRRP